MNSHKSPSDRVTAIYCQNRYLCWMTIFSRRTRRIRRNDLQNAIIKLVRIWMSDGFFGHKTKPIYYRWNFFNRLPFFMIRPNTVRACIVVVGQHLAFVRRRPKRRVIDKFPTIYVLYYVDTFPRRNEKRSPCKKYSLNA